MSQKRSKPIARPIAPAARTQPHDVSEPAGDDRRGRLFALLGLAWLIGFCLYFYSFELPNNQADVINTRMGVWLSLSDFSLVTEFLSARWGNLAERADIFGIAAFMLVTSWAVGELALRLIRPSLARGSAERLFFAMALGLSGVSLVTLGLGLAGWLNRALFIVVFSTIIVFELVLQLCERFRSPQDGSHSKILAHSDGRGQGEGSSSFVFWLSLAAITPFVMLMWLGSMSPEKDFDVLAYHFEGPKEYFLNGGIGFLPHNIYTNFPFLTEMFTLAGMVVRNDWFRGALAGKCVLFAFAPLTALGLFALGRCWFNSTVGLLAAVVHLTTPWIYRISIIAYAEGGLSFYLFATLYAVLLGLNRLRNNESPLRPFFIAGLLAGSGMACKYTGVMQVVLPMGLAVVAAPIALRRPGAMKLTVQSALVFALGVAITIGPWLLKNLAETGNPVYPLAYRIFGGVDIDPDLNAKFESGHTSHTPRPFLLGLRDVVTLNDWSSPLCFGLAPLAFLIGRRRGIVVGLWLLVAYLFVTWWAFTHQIDRFWVPMIPVVALLAGIGAAWSQHPFWKWGVAIVMALAIWFNLGYIAGAQTWQQSGYNALLTDLATARRIAVGQSPIAFLNATLPKSAKVLCVGKGDVFDAQFPIVYNTVFDRSIFQDWCAAPVPDANKTVPGTNEKDLPLKPAKEILAKLHAEGITHVLVDWDWIRRYRAPGNYGYSDFVTPAKFDELVQAGVLAPPKSLAILSVEGLTDEERDRLKTTLLTRGLIRSTQNRGPVIVTDFFGQLSNDDRDSLKEFAPWLLTKSDGQDVVIDAQVFAVR